MNKTKIEISAMNYEVSDGKRHIYFLVEGNRVKFLNEYQDRDFIFSGKIDNKTLEHWESILKLMLNAVKFLKTKGGKNGIKIKD